MPSNARNLSKLLPVWYDPADENQTTKAKSPVGKCKHYLPYDDTVPLGSFYQATVAVKIDASSGEVSVPRSVRKSTKKHKPSETPV